MSALQDTDEPQDGPDDCATLIERLEKIVKDTLQTFISKCIEKKEQYAIIRLKTNKEGVEKGTHKTIKEYYTFCSREFRESAEATGRRACRGRATVLSILSKPLIIRNGKRVEIKELPSTLEKVFEDDE